MIAFPLTGWIGLGSMGLPMATNLLRAGVPLTLFNRTGSRAESLQQQGARLTASPRQLAEAVELLMLCVSDAPDVEAVLFGADGAAWGLRPGSLVIDCSTIAPERTRAFAQRLSGRGVDWVDAPVTGGTEAAAAGSLTVLLGGEPGAVARARPLLAVLASNLAHFGPVGAGQQAKAVNQVLVAGSYAAVAEAMALGEGMGLPMEQVITALQTGAAGSWGLGHRGASMLERSFPLGFRLRLHRKDLGIALAEAEARGLDLPISRLVAALEDRLIDQGYGDEDVSALARAVMPPSSGTKSSQP